MGNLIFKDSKTTRSKTLVMAKPEDDIVLILPDNPGILATTNTLSRELYGGDTPIDISNILKPNILENNGGIVDSTSNNKPLERASYRTTNAYKGKLDFTEWIAATDALFKNIIDHTTDREHVDSWLPNIGTPSTKVFVRYRFHSGVLKSPWSDSLVYTTPAFGIYKFKVTVDSRTMSPTITTSGYRAYGENVVGNIRHIATSWKIYEGSELVYSSEYNTTDKLTHTVPVGYLDPNTNYRAAVTYHSDNKSYRDSPIGIADFTTPNIYIKKPIIAYKYKSGVHTIDAEPYVIVGSNEPHVATTWEVYRFENDRKVLCYRKEQDRDRLTTIAINDYLYGKIRKYEVVATFHSDTYQSAPGKTKFEIVDNKIEDAVLTVTGNTNEFPTMKILAPGFAIEGDSDKVVRTAFKVNDTITGKETLNLDLTTFIGLGRYTDNDNPPGTAINRVTNRFFYSWFDSEADNNGELPMVTLSGYLVGDKYNSPMLSTNYIPNLDYKVPTTIKPLTNMLVKVFSSGFRYAANAPLKLQIEEIKYIVSGGKYFNKVVKHIDNAGVRALESNPDNIANSQAGYGVEEFDLPTSGDFIEGYDYGKNYTLYVRIKTQIGWINVSKQNFSVYQGKISDPNGTIGHDIAGIGRCRLTILSDNYSNDMLGKVPGSEYKHTNIKVYKVSDGSLVADVDFPRDIGTVPAKISALDYNGIDWNTNYNIDITYEAVNGLRSKTVRFPYGTPMKPEIRVTAPTVTATTNDRVIIATGSPFSIVGTEDKSHYSTTWELYDPDNTLLYRYPKDTEHLTSIEFPNTLIEYGKTYRVQAIYHGVSDISSGIGFTTVATFGAIVKNFIDNIGTNNIFLDWGVWFDQNHGVTIDFSTGVVRLYDYWKPHRGMNTYMWYMDCLGKNIKRDSIAVGTNSRDVSFTNYDLKLSKEDYTFLFSNIELYGWSGNLTRSSDGYIVYHLPTPSEPYLHVYAQDDYSDADSRHKFVYARLKESYINTLFSGMGIVHGVDGRGSKGRDYAKLYGINDANKKYISRIVMVGQKHGGSRYARTITWDSNVIGIDACLQTMWLEEYYGEPDSDDYRFTGTASITIYGVTRNYGFYNED